MDQSPTLAAVGDALAELQLYADTDEAEAARELVRGLLDDLDAFDDAAP